MVPPGLQAIATWWRRREALKEARFQADLALIQARGNLAFYEAKADIEWDMKWSQPIRRTWLTQIVAVTMSVPVVAWFVPWTHEYAEKGLQLLIKLHPDAPLYFAGGWVLMFATVFGVGQVKNLLMPGRLANLVSAIGKAPNDVPDNDDDTAPSR